MGSWALPVGPGRGEAWQWGCVLGTFLWGPRGVALLSPVALGSGGLGPSGSLLGGLRGPVPSATLQDPSLEEGSPSRPPGCGVCGGDVPPARPDGRLHTGAAQARHPPGSRGCAVCALGGGALGTGCPCWGRRAPAAALPPPPQRPYDIHSSNAVESLVQLFSTVSVQYVPTWSKEMVALLRKVSPRPPG